MVTEVKMVLPKNFNSRQFRVEKNTHLRMVGLCDLEICVSQKRFTLRLSGINLYQFKKSVLQVLSVKVSCSEALNSKRGLFKTYRIDSEESEATFEFVNIITTMISSTLQTIF